MRPSTLTWAAGDASARATVVSHWEFTIQVFIIVPSRNFFDICVVCLCVMYLPNSFNVHRKTFTLLGTNRNVGVGALVKGTK